MTIFVDTSAFYALYDRQDVSHQAAVDRWTAILKEGDRLITTNYVLLETAILLRNRLGLDSVRAFRGELMPLVAVECVSLEQHQAAMDAVLAAARRKLSVVDCVSFQTMRRLDIQAAFCFDTHFREQGFVVQPPWA